MKKTMILMAMATALVSACVDQNEVQSVVVGQADDVSDNGDAAGESAGPTVGRCSVADLGFEADNDLVDHGGETVDESTGEPLFAVLSTAKAYGYGDSPSDNWGIVDVEFKGCLSEPNDEGMGFIAFSEEGELLDVYGWGMYANLIGENGERVEARVSTGISAVEVASDGALTMVVKVRFNARFDAVRRIKLKLVDREGNLASNWLEVDVEAPVFLQEGETCSDFGKACSDELWCSRESVCEAF